MSVFPVLFCLLVDGLSSEKMRFLFLPKFVLVVDDIEIFIALGKFPHVELSYSFGILARLIIVTKFGVEVPENGQQRYQSLYLRNHEIGAKG